MGEEEIENFPLRIFIFFFLRENIFFLKGNKIFP